MMSLKKIALAVAVSLPLMGTTGVFAHAQAPAKPVKLKLAHIKDTVAHLVMIRHAFSVDLKHATSEKEVLDIATNITHVEDAILTLHALEKTYHDVQKLKK